MSAVTQTALAGFPSPVYDTARAFRCLLDAMARPGQIGTLDHEHDVPRGLNQSATALLMTLSDMETKVWLAPDVDTSEAREFIAFQTGSRVVDTPELADFVVASAQSDPGFRPALRIGTPESPDQSATLILLLPSLENGAEVTLTGPGVDTSIALRADGLDEDFWSWFASAAGAFPCGVDVFLTSGTQVLGLPRSVKVEV